MTTSVTTVIWLPVLRQDAFCENIFQQIRDTLGRLNGCYHQKVGIHISKIDLISGVVDELRQECALEQGRAGIQMHLHRAVSALAQAKQLHDEMETFYVPNMDFGQWQKRLDALLQTLG